MKLWNKSDSIDKEFEKFTIGHDPVLDLNLAVYDVKASIAHVKMLGGIGLVSKKECIDLIEALEEIEGTIDQNKFIIEEGVEDCHSQIELLLIRKLGDIGKKVHSGRSRNDQVLTALKLFAKAELISISNLLNTLFYLLIQKSEEHKEILIPGYTHMQIAMPSSFGLWFGAYAESLLDDLIQLKCSYRIVDKNPLGSAAGYGSSFPLDRQQTTDDLGFSALNVNSIYAQMTRGKMEKSVAFTMNSLASTLSKFAMDVCLFSGQNFNFISIDKKFVTGSSIMPHKNNPDGFELIRAKCNQIQALPYTLNLILTNLPSGYHRDLQVIKEHFIKEIQSLKDCLKITVAMTESLKVRKDIVDDPKYDLIFSVESVNELVKQGIPFRDAYHQISAKIKDGSYQPVKKLSHTHIGSLGNLSNDKIVSAFENEMAFFDAH